MKKNLLKGLAVAALAMIAGYNMYQAHSETEGMSELMLANVEALASGESVAGEPCYKGEYDTNLPSAVKCDHPCRQMRCGGSIDKCY